MKFGRHMSKLDGFLWLTVNCLPCHNFRHKTVCFTEQESTELCLKNPIRIEYLIKQKPRGTLAEKQVLTERRER